MSDCQAEAVEALFRGELDPAAAARVSAHLGVCPECTEELRWLERERSLFQSRADACPPPPAFEEVLAAARRIDKSKTTESNRALRAPRGARPWTKWGIRAFGIAAAAAIVAVLFAPPEPPPEVAAEPLAPKQDDPRVIQPDQCYACAPAPASAQPAEPEPQPEFKNPDCARSSVTPTMCEPQEE
jgi:anti-sigma factor RsiW